MGLFDNLDDPKNQALLQLAAGLLSGSGRTNKNFGADLGAAIPQGLMGLNQGRALQSRERDAEQQRQMHAMQLAQMQSQNDQQQRMGSLAQQFQRPGMPQMQPTDQETPSGPPGPGSMDWHGYSNALSSTPGINPMAALDVQSKIAALKQKNYQKLGAGDTLYDVDAGKAAFTAPDKPPAGFKTGPDGGLVVDQAWLDAQRQIRAAGKPQVTVDNRQENAFAQTAGKEFGEQYVGLMKGDANASGKLNKLERLSNLLDNSGKTGKFTPNVMELKAAADSLGFKVDAKLPYQQAAQALSNEIALEMRNPSGGAGMPGALSDSDRVFLTNMVPNLAKTPEGNKQLLDTAKKLAQRDKQVAALARDYKKKNGKFDEGFYEVLGAFSERNPLFPKPRDNGGWSAERVQ